MAFKLFVRGIDQLAELDDEDIHLAQYAWFVVIYPNGHTYAYRRVLIDGKWVRILMHRDILGLKKGDPLVDHKDGNGLNCRRGNIRVSNNVENAHNRKSANRTNKHSPYVGVCWSTRNQKWRAYIMDKGYKHQLGNFSDIEEAHRARLAKEAEIWGIEPRRESVHNTISVRRLTRK